MTKDEIRQEIKDARKRHSAELKALEAKLNEPEMWEPKPYIALSAKEQGEFRRHKDRQGMLWKLANDLNKGWMPDWDDTSETKYDLYFHLDEGEWKTCEITAIKVTNPVFTYESGNKACEILNNQPELMQ